MLTNSTKRICKLIYNIIAFILSVIGGVVVCLYLFDQLTIHNVDSVKFRECWEKDNAN